MVAGQSKSYILTLTAEDDFIEAKQWSLSRWGKKQTKQYFADLHQGAEYVAHNYQTIAEKNNLTGDTGLEIYPIREHYLVYLPIKNNFIIIVALIRQVRDVPAILKANNYLFRREFKDIAQMLESGELDDLPDTDR